MNNKNELKIKLKELEANLKNITVQNELERQNLNLDDLKQTIQYYYENIEQFNAEDLNIISTKVFRLVFLGNQTVFSGNAHEFTNIAHYLIDNRPVVDIGVDDNLNIQDNTQISEEEFSKRYDTLIESLNFEGEECSLILETPSEKRPFKVYKTKTKSLAIYAKFSEKPMTIAADRLLEVAFGRKAPTYPSYDNVIISKIMDNSIFDFLVISHHSNDLLDAMKTKLSNNENELLKLSSKLVEIEKNNQELSIAKEQLAEILIKSALAQDDFENAKEAAVSYAKLNASVSHWQTKQEIHSDKSIRFGILAIVFIGFLVFILFKVVPYHENQINESKKIEIVSDINITNESKKTIQDIDKSISVIKQTLQEPKKIISNNEENSKAFNFDYSKLAWYILMIFASSSAFWIIRITVKIALSNLHLSEDAHERVVMIQTYLSFVKEGQIDENDKNLILSSLFRPSNIGIIKDESSVTVADIITAFKK